MGVSIPATIIDGFCIIAVNCYILISGYYGIKASWKGFVKLYSICAFYGITLILISIWKGNDFSIKDLILAILPFWKSQWWFVNVYFHLFLLSPFLNFVISKCNKSQLLKCTLLLGFLSVLYYFFSSGGYDIANFTVLYFIGRYIQLYTENVTTKEKKLLLLSIYSVLSLITGILVLSTFSNYFLSYNSPLITFASIAFFMLFRTFSFQSKLVNWLATSAFAVYLIHCNKIILPYFNYFFNFIKDSFGDYWYFSVLVFIGAGTILLALLLVDKIRILISNPIEKYFAKIPVEIYIKKGISAITQKATNKQ